MPRSDSAWRFPLIRASGRPSICRPHVHGLGQIASGVPAIALDKSPYCSQVVPQTDATLINSALARSSLPCSTYSSPRYSCVFALLGSRARPWRNRPSRRRHRSFCDANSRSSSSSQELSPSRAHQALPGIGPQSPSLALLCRAICRRGYSSSSSRISEKRNYFVRTATALSFTLGTLVAAAVFLATVVVIPLVFNALYLFKGLEWLIRIASYVLMLAMTLVGVGLPTTAPPMGHGGLWLGRSPGYGYR